MVWEAIQEWIRWQQGKSGSRDDTLWPIGSYEFVEVIFNTDSPAWNLDGTGTKIVPGTNGKGKKASWVKSSSARTVLCNILEW